MGGAIREACSSRRNQIRRSVTRTVHHYRNQDVSIHGVNLERGIEPLCWAANKRNVTAPDVEITRSAGFIHANDEPLVGDGVSPESCSTTSPTIQQFCVVHVRRVAPWATCSGRTSFSRGFPSRGSTHRQGSNPACVSRRTTSSPLSSSWNEAHNHSVGPQTKDTSPQRMWRLRGLPGSSTQMISPLWEILYSQSRTLPPFQRSSGFALFISE